MNIRAFVPIDKAEFHRFIATEPEGRYEYARGRIVETHGGTNRHFRIARLFSRLLEAQLDSKAWLVFQEFGVESSQTVRFPDIVVLPASDPSTSRWTQAPALIVEVLSPSTTSLDLDEKPTEYMNVDTLAAYVVASQTEAACLAWVRGSNGTFPARPCEYTTGQTIAIPALGIAIEVAAIYAELELNSRGPSPHG